MYSKQSGFRKYHSTETALIRIVDQLLFSLDENRASSLLLIDYPKAFDMVDHKFLLAKLHAYGMSETAVNWFQSYLSDRQQFVALWGKNSGYLHVPHGVPQGSILGPLLFIVFINDLPLHVQASGVDTDLYADDTTSTASVDVSEIGKRRTSLSDALQNVETWASGNKLPLNETKTKSILVTGKRLANKLERWISNLSYIRKMAMFLNKSAQRGSWAWKLMWNCLLPAMLISCVKSYPNVQGC